MYNNWPAKNRTRTQRLESGTRFRTSSGSAEIRHLFTVKAKACRGDADMRKEFNRVYNLQRTGTICGASSGQVTARDGSKSMFTLLRGRMLRSGNTRVSPSRFRSDSGAGAGALMSYNYGAGLSSAPKMCRRVEWCEIAAKEATFGMGRTENAAHRRLFLNAQRSSSRNGDWDKLPPMGGRSSRRPGA